MRLRNLLAATTASALLITGAASTAAHAALVPSQDAAGTVVSWGNTEDASSGPAMAVPGDLTAPVVTMAANNNATAVVTTDGHLRVWGKPDAPEVDQAPSDITDAVSVSLGYGSGAALRSDGTISAWGGAVALTDVPTELHAKAVAVSIGTGYAVSTDGTLVMWGDDPGYPLPTSGLADLVDVSASLFQVLALRADGGVVAWNSPYFPAFALPDFGGKKVTQIATSVSANGVVFEDGTIKLWGSSVPAGTPDFDGLTPATSVKSLSLGTNAGAITEDGVVHTWGTDADVNTVPASLVGKPVASIAMGDKHAAVIVTSFRDLTTPNIAGTPMVGQTLTATPATYSLAPDAAATGQWFAGEEAIEGQTGTTLALDDALVSKSISYHSTAMRGAETVTSVSDPVGPVVAKTNATVTVSAAKGAYGKTSTVTVSVPGATGNVNLTVDGKSVGTKALAAGKASFSIIKTTKPGYHALKASYAGSDTHNAATKAATLVVAKGATGKPVMKVRASHKKKGTVRVSVATSAGLVKATGKAQLVLKKGKSTKKVNLNVKNGKATGKLPKLAKGTWKAYVTYKGSTYYVAVKSKTIKVKSK